jgi:hypothetical protein
MGEFKMDDPIVVSDYEDFRKKEIAYFIVDLRKSTRLAKTDYPIRVIDQSGHAEMYRFARGIEPKVQRVFKGGSVMITHSQIKALDDAKRALYDVEQDIINSQ